MSLEAGATHFFRQRKVPQQADQPAGHVMRFTGESMCAWPWEAGGHAGPTAAVEKSTGLVWRRRARASKPSRLRLPSSSWRRSPRHSQPVNFNSSHQALILPSLTLAELAPPPVVSPPPLTPSAWHSPPQRPCTGLSGASTRIPQRIEAHRGQEGWPLSGQAALVPTADGRTAWH